MKRKFLLTILFLFSAVTLFAQIGTPTCGTDGDIDDGPCPIDTWVVFFAALALIITTVHLYKKQTNAVKLSDK
ncbi:hypothetical protein [Mucilaginibacter sp. dw_454]|uniref:hypothetical protein n=1 Tax=Mucilaginibacter sp. dw_454 TaxID=2720079 RepID=UPI001BD27F51|nr:hypothetical protein [Mucilaginibacter sp. dw_454]